MTGMRVRVLGTALALGLMLSLAGCGGSPDRQAAGVSGTLAYPACGSLSEEPACILDANSGGPDFGQTVVLNGSSVLFGDAEGLPAGAISLKDVCWAPADGVEASECTSAGKQMPASVASVTTIDGYPAVAFDAPKAPDADGEEVYVLPAYVDVSVDGRVVRIEIACCERVA